MSPLIKKALYRIKKIKRPPIFGGKENPAFKKGLRRYTMAGLLVLLAILIIHSTTTPIRTQLKEGDVATDDIYAPFSFSYEAGIDEEKTKAAEEKASAAVLDVYNLEPTLYERYLPQIEKFFNELETIQNTKAQLKTTALNEFIEKSKTQLTVNELNKLLNYEGGLYLLKCESETSLKETFSNPIISADTARALKDSKTEKISLYQKGVPERFTKSVTKLVDMSDPYGFIERILDNSNIKEKETRDVIAKLLAEWITPNAMYNQQETEAAKKLAASMTPPIFNILNRIKGEAIIRKGQIVTKDHIAQLSRIASSYAQVGIFSQLGGITIFIFLLVFLLLVYLKYFEPAIFVKDKLLLLIGLSLLFVAMSARVVVSSPLPTYFIPTAAAPILLALLINSSVAAIGAIAAAIIVALIAGAKFNIFLVSMISSIYAISCVYRARRHSQIFKAGVYVGILNFVTICTIGLLSNFEIKVFLKEGLWGMGSGITSALIAMAFSPFVESLFGLTSDIRLLELGDPNHPLLKDMVMHAPGTYHHSVVVGNLSEAACDAIGANSLLARVAAYYHDIGKTQKAEYFSENQNSLSSTHDKLTPSMSSLIITNHVKDGVELAEKYKLGTTIKDIIEQHHGSGLVTYFYHQALEKTQEEDIVSEEGFRYAGPKPQTKEAAVVMLADSVEAASRALQNPTPQRLKELVRKIINNKFMDRQLEDCDITLKDINKISDSFVRVLMGIYHSRVDYPDDNVITRHADNNKQRTKKNQA